MLAKNKLKKKPQQKLPYLHETKCVVGFVLFLFYCARFGPERATQKLSENAKSSSERKDNHTKKYRETVSQS